MSIHLSTYPLFLCLNVFSVDSNSPLRLSVSSGWGCRAGRLLSRTCRSINNE